MLTQQDVNDPGVLFALATALQGQQLFGPATVLLKDVEIGLKDRQPLLVLYQKQIQARWGQGPQLSMKENGDFLLTLVGQKQITDLQPLKGLMLHQLSAFNGPKVSSLKPLRGMPLNRLAMNQCDLKDLRPLKNMPLTALHLVQCAEINDLEPLRGMPLTDLNLNSSVKLADLSPLKGMPLETLDLNNCRLLTDLRTLESISSLTTLVLQGCYQMSNLEPLRGMRKLRTLSIAGCRVRTLEPLKTLPLEVLDMKDNVDIEDLSPLWAMPLVNLDLQRCAKVHDLTPLRGLKLQTIAISPKHINKGMEVLRKMASLKTVSINDFAYPSDDFWKRFEAGDFQK